MKKKIMAVMMLVLLVCGCSTGQSSGNLSDDHSNTTQSFEASSSGDSVIPEKSSEKSSGVVEPPVETEFESSYEDSEISESSSKESGGIDKPPEKTAFVSSYEYSAASESSSEESSGVVEPPVETAFESSYEDSVIPENSSEESSGIDEPPEETAFESSYEAVADMRIGWNIGNSLDSAGNLSGTQASAFETAWGNPVTTPELIAAIKDAGFGAVRVPVTWYCNMDENGTVNGFWLDRVEEVVKFENK